MKSFYYHNIRRWSQNTEEINIEEIDIFDGEVDQSEKIFYSATMPSFVSLFSGNSVKPLYFVKLISKDVAEMDISDPYRHFVAKGERYFQGYYLKLCCSKDIKVKEIQFCQQKSL